MASFLKFSPLYRERVWGGRALAKYLGRKIPAKGPIGESWEIVDRPDAQSTVQSGPWAGKTLHQLLTAHGAEVMGPAWPAARRFPILVKWLDCSERLSLQVHPPLEVAGTLGVEPKTENWYFAHTERDAAVIAGLKPGVTIKKFEKALANGTVGADKAPGAGQNEHDRVFGDRLRIDVSGDAKRNPSPVQRRDIHRVVADPMA